MLSLDLDTTISDLRQRLGSALLAVDIWDTTSALTLAGFDSRPATGPVLQGLADDLRTAAALCGTGLSDHLVLTSAGRSVVVVTAGTLAAAVQLTDDVRPVQLLSQVVPTLRAVLAAA